MTTQEQAIVGLIELPARGGAETVGSRLIPLAQGALFAAAFGVALGMGAFHGHVLGLAVAVPLTFAASIAVAIPSLFVVLSMLDAPMALGELLDTAGDAFRHSGIVLGGLAPSLLLFSASIADREMIDLLGCGGLWLAALLGAYRLTSEARITLLKRAGKMRPRHGAILLAFVGLSFEIAGSFWSTALSLFGGLS